MRSTRLIPFWIALALVVCLAVPSRAGTLHVFAAVSLTEAFSDMGHAFESRHPGSTVEFNFAGSQILRTQIEQGALADVFASADRTHADALCAEKLLESVHVFARNGLVVITPKEAPRVETLGDLARPRRKIVIAGPAVPAGRYTLQVLRHMTGSGLYGKDYQARVTANVVSQESNVRQVLAKVALGEADAGFVYRTDAAPGKVRILAIPERLNVIAEYPIGVVGGTHAPELAREFVAFVDGPAGQAILKKYGFMN